MNKKSKEFKNMPKIKSKKMLKVKKQRRKFCRPNVKKPMSLSKRIKLIHLLQKNKKKAS